MNPCFDTLRAELETAKAGLADPIEGLSDLARLNLKPDTATVVGIMLDIYQRRGRLLERALASLDALLRDGYPRLSRIEADPLIWGDLTRNLRTIRAGLALFDAPASEEAVVVTIEAGTAVPKTES